MTLPSGLNVRFIRLVAALIVPGAIMAVTFTPLVFKLYKDELEWIKSAGAVAQGTGFFLLSVFFGMLLENIGGRIELLLSETEKFSEFKTTNHQSDERNEKLDKIKEDEEDWYHYLLRPIGSDCIMVRYIGELVMRMKFELSVMLSLPLSWFFWVMTPLNDGVHLCCKPVIPLVLISGVSLWMFIEARSSIKVLNKCRKKLRKDDARIFRFPLVRPEG